MRTYKRRIAELNPGKLKHLAEIAVAYRAEKRHWLSVFERTDTRHLIKQSRKVRDQALKDKYVSKSGLQARMWKLALTDAADIGDRHWQALIVEIRGKLMGHELVKDDEEAKHYVNWLLCGYKQFFECLEGSTPAPKFKHAANLPMDLLSKWVRFAVRRVRGNNPSGKLARSFVLDEDCYKVFEHKDKQWISVMSLQRGKRIVLPLSGRTTMTGNIKIVIEGTSVKVHCTAGLKAKTELAASKSNTVALDFGYTEVFTDHEGIHYGAGLGKIITQSSDKRNSKGKARNKIDSLSKTYAASNNPKHQRKARHLRRFNLGKVKLYTNEERTRAAIDCEVNTAFNALIKTKQPEALVVEDLRHTFTFNRPRGANRRLSAWVKGSIQDRADFKSKGEGFCLKQVNPAYGSQTCPCCGYVDSKNRNGDVFECLHCKHRNQADRVAALNYLARESDPVITVYTPYKKVNDILLARFHRRLESEGAGWPEGTVPGRTLDTVTASPQKVRSRRKSQQVEANILDNLTVTQRAKQNKVDKTIHQ